jgi:hypothetical protein
LALGAKCRFQAGDLGGVDDISHSFIARECHILSFRIHTGSGNYFLVLAGLDGGTGSSMTFDRKFIDVLASQAIFLGNPFGTFSLMDQIVSRFGDAKASPRENEVAPHWNTRHIFNTAPDRIGNIAGGYFLGREVYRLLTRSAHAIERNRRDLHGESRSQGRDATDIRPLFLDRGDAATNDIADRSFFDAGFAGQFSKQVGKQDGRVGFSKCSVPTAKWCADSIDDDWFAHDNKLPEKSNRRGEESVPADQDGKWILLSSNTCGDRIPRPAPLTLYIVS